MYRPLLLALVLVCGTARAALPDLSGPFVQAKGHLSAFSDVSSRSLLAGTFGYGGVAGWRWGAWGAFLTVEHDLWLTSELDREVVQGA